MGDTLNKILTAPFPAVPQYESIFAPNFRYASEFDDLFKKYKTLIFIGNYNANNQIYLFNKKNVGRRKFGEITKK